FRSVSVEVDGLLGVNCSQQTVQTAGNPRRMRLKFQDKNAIVFQQTARGLYRLNGVYIVVDSHGRIVRNIGVRIEKRVDNQIEVLFAVLDVASRIVYDRYDTRRRIWPLEVRLTPERLNQRVDFNGDNATRPVAKCRSDVVTHSRTQNQHVWWTSRKM